MGLIARITRPPAPALSESWPHGTAATAYLARDESLLNVRGLDGTDRLFRPLLRRIVDAFKTRDMAGVRVGCDALLARDRESAMTRVAEVLTVFGRSARRLAVRVQW